MGIHAHICASASLRWVRSLQGADISTSERRKRTWAGIAAVSASHRVPGSGWGHLGIPPAPVQDTHSGAGACAHPTTETPPGAGGHPWTDQKPLLAPHWHHSHSRHHVLGRSQVLDNLEPLRKNVNPQKFCILLLSSLNVFSSLFTATALQVGAAPALAGTSLLGSCQGTW